jgi:hypothetical protein
VDRKDDKPTGHCGDAAQGCQYAVISFGPSFYWVQTLVLTFVGLFPQASLENQLSDGREWLFDTEQPSLADISIYLIYAWVRTLSTEALLNHEIHSCTVKVRSSCHSSNFTAERYLFVHTH